jgi:hypothetical protein
MKKESVERELEEIRKQKKKLDSCEREIYKWSLRAPESEKLCPDWMAEQFAKDDYPNFIQYPVTINGIHHKENKTISKPLLHPETKWVKVRPCGKEYGDKTYLGILLGEIALTVSCSLTRDGILEIGHSMHNPAIYVPDLHEIIFGCGSWWGAIKDPDDARNITDADIGDVWYVRMLNDMEAGQPETTGD